MPEHPFQPGDHIFAYLRDSGHEKQELSIGQQEDAIRAWCAERGLILEHVYKDEARKGSSVIGRSELNALMNAFRHGADVAGVVVWKYNRFARNIDNAQFLRAEIRTRGYTFYSLNDKVPEGPEAIIFEAVIDYADQQYLTNMSIDVKRGLYNLVKNYGCMPGTPPTGFKREKVIISYRRDGSPHIAHRWIPDPDVAPRVRQAFEMRAAGSSLGEINAETHLFNTINSYATFWPNKLYKGTLVFGDDIVIENYCEPMVDEKTWDIVQARQNHFARSKHLKGGSIDHPRRASSKYLLSGLAHCAQCGAPMFGTTSSQRNGSVMRSYFCSRAYRTRDCTRQRIPVVAFDAAVITRLREEIHKPDYLASMLAEKRAMNASHQADHDAQRHKITSDLGETRRQITNVTDAISEQKHSRALLKRLADLEAQETRLQTELASLDADHTQLPPNEASIAQLTATLAYLEAALTSSDIQVQRSILRQLIKRVDIDRNGKELFGLITIYIPPGDENPPEDDDKPSPSLPHGPTPKTVRMSREASGPPRYTHSFSFTFDITTVDKRYKKSRSR
jgi:site-specific DNA recombinase